MSYASQLMSDKDDFLKSVQDAHSALKNIAGADAKDETFPKLPHNLRGGLEKLRSTLAEHSITFQFLERTSSGNRVLFSKIASPAASNVPELIKAPANLTRSVPDVADVPEGEIPAVELDEMPEVVNE